MAKNKSTKPVVEVLDDDDDDLELTDADEVEDAEPKSNKKGKPAKKAVAAKESTALGAAWLATHINDQLGTELTGANVRVILRKLASEGDLDREVGTDRARYQFTGENDKTVKAVLRLVKSGALDREKADRLAAARAAKADKAAKAEEDDDAPAPKAKKAKKSAPVEEPAPAKATRKRKA